jgi:hypothetical protein
VVVLLGAALLIAMLIVVTFLPMADNVEAVEVGFYWFLFAGLWLYWALGVVVVLRADGHTVGWLFAVAVQVPAWGFACFVLGYALTIQVPPDPMGNWLVLAGVLADYPAIILMLPAVALIFPTGTLPGPRWRGPVAVVVALVAVRSVALLLKPGPMGDGGPVNPLTPWLAWMPQGVVDFVAVLEVIGSLSLPIGAALGVAALLVRARRSIGIERQQLKWLLVAMVPPAILVPLSLPPDIAAAAPWISLLSVATLPLVALAVALAVLRYRLYDIDRIVSRTLSYALVTGVLALVFIGTNLALQSVLSLATGGSTLTVAASTLVVAALFQPGRRRIQAPIDRRFNRARGDAERVVTGFSARARDEVDLAELRRSVVAAADDAVQPAGAGLWLRGNP